jgi:hypothetical protein
MAPIRWQPDCTILLPLGDDFGVTKTGAGD